MTGQGGEAAGERPRRRSRFSLAAAGTLALFFFVVFVALGTWQLQRRVWKLDLIARVEQRVHAPAVAVPGAAEWPRVTAATHEYLRVYASGTFLDESQTLVQAVTVLGPGYWVLTPLRMTDGSVVIVNRGFVTADDRGRVARAAGGVGARPGVAPGTALGVAPGEAAGGEPPLAHVTGLLRMTEPRGAFLRHNDPAENHWYSRDVEAIAAARGLSPAAVAPYFIDAAADGVTPAPGGDSVGRGVDEPGAVVPVGGMTVISFHNSHLVYAITWYTLALMVAVAIGLGIRNEARA